MARELIPSRTLLRRDFLARIADISPNTILDLFKGVLTPFKALGRCTVECFDNEYPCTQFISFGMLDSDEWLGPEFSEERRLLQKALKDWGTQRGLLNDWAYEHAIHALRCFEVDTLDTEAALQAWRRACLRLDEQAKKESVSPEAVMIWRDGVFGSSRELVEKLQPVVPPQPPPYFPPRAIRFNRPDTRAQYEKAVMASFADQLNKGLAAYMPGKLRRECVRVIFDKRRPEFERYCQDYDEHLKRYGWSEVSDMREFEYNCDLMILYLCEKRSDSQLGDGLSIENSAIRKRRKELATALGLTLPERRGRR